MFNAANMAHMFPFQTVDWPSVPITLVYVDQQVLPDPPPAVRPNAAELSAFMYRFASRRGEYDDLVRGYYYAADLIGCRFVLYHLQPQDEEEDQPQLLWCLTTPFHESYARIDCQRPHDLNAVVRMICIVNFTVSDALAPELAVCRTHLLGG